jgi:hypothetical protein
MPKIIPIATKRDWLKKYEDGEAIASIAKVPDQPSFPVATVKSGIEWAINERLATEIRGDSMKQAFRRHQEGLLKVVQQLHDMIGVPRLGNLKDKPPMEFDGLLVTHDPGIGYVLTYVVENDPLWPSVIEHIGKKDKAIADLRKIKEQVESHIRALNELKSLCERRLNEKTKLSLIDNSSSPSEKEHYLHNQVVPILCSLAIKVAKDGADVSIFRDAFIVEDGRRLIYKGAILANAPGEGKKIKTNLLEVLGLLISKGEGFTPEMAKVIDTMSEAEKRIEPYKQVLQEIILSGYFSGKCKVCQRIGIQ